MKRVFVGKGRDVVPPPYFLEVQKKSWEWFLQQNVPPEKRKVQGLQELFLRTFPIKSPDGNIILEFVEYEIGEPRYTPEESLKRDVSYAAPLKVKLRTRFLDTGEVIEQTVFFGEIPLMTETGHFIYNGTERVVINQLQRSPGVLFSESEEVPGGYEARIAPHFGTWLDIFLLPDKKGHYIFHMSLNQRRKFSLLILLKAFGIEDSLDLLKRFYRVRKVSSESDEAIGHLLALEVKDPRTGRILFYPTEPVSKDNLERIRGAGIKELWILDLDENDPPYLLQTIRAEVLKQGDKEKNFVHVDREDALRLIFEYYRGGEPYPGEDIKEFFHNMFFNPKTYDLAAVGRFKLNQKLGLNLPLDQRTLTLDDIIATMKHLMKLVRGEAEVDDIDHLGNRRIRSVGELIFDHLRPAFAKFEKQTIDRMLLAERDEMTPQKLVNIRAITTAIAEFFGQNPLSQYMDQTNPLSELTHKRRLSALGPGGLSRERAGYEVRDVHYTHYGKICPIETPEGPNIGLIVSMTTYAKINEFGFLQTPYRKVENGKVTDEIVYLTADEEDRYNIAQAETPVDENGNIISEFVTVRQKGNYPMVPKDEVHFIEISPRQVVSVSTSLIPFLENDDANRALMGSNMQRQAVPLVRTEAPLVGTGMEAKAAADIGAVVKAKRAGVVKYVDASKIVIKTKDGEDVYELIKFRKTNSKTCYNQKPIVKKGQRVKAGQVIADGPSTCNGELALGKNVLVAFIPWYGYNFEDAVVISERLVRDDVFTSVHIEVFEVEARDTKFGKEQITRDIPNLPDSALKHLDENGIVVVGTEVKPGDILVGKVTPRGEQELSPEARLLHSIFGERAREVRDTSLRLPHGWEGVVIRVERFSREEKDELPPGVEERVKVYVASKRPITVGDKFAGRHGNKGVVSKIVPIEDMPFLADGTPVDMVLNPLGVPSRMNVGQLFETNLGWACKEIGRQVAQLLEQAAKAKQEVAAKLRQKLKKLSPNEDWDSISDDELIEMAKEWKNGVRVASPVFSKAAEDVERWLQEAGLPVTGKTVVYDGKTGEPLDCEVTVGYMYMMKLIHMATDKIHARSTGPYSLVTQQPLGGKAQFGGQRLGEMEVWALEAYGAAHTLEEFLTIKSDDVSGRAKMYAAIVKGQNPPPPGIPESFNVLLRELRGLALDMRIFDESGAEIDPDESDESIFRLREARRLLYFKKERL